MKQKILVAISCLGLMTACGGGSSATGGGSTASVANVAPGSTLPLTTTVIANTSGTYVLPIGANSLATRCTGQVTLTIPASPSPQVNTCSSPTGSSGMTNVVSGVANVTYTFDAGASARITVN